MNATTTATADETPRRGYVTAADVDAVFAAIEDLGRDADPTDLITEATAALRDLQIIMDYVQQRRAEALADASLRADRSLHQVHGELQPRLAALPGTRNLGVSGMSWAIQHHGPLGYVAVGPEHDAAGDPVVWVVAVAPHINHANARSYLRALAHRGALILPATRRLVDPATGQLAAGVDLAGLHAEYAEYAAARATAAPATRHRVAGHVLRYGGMVNDDGQLRNGAGPAVCQCGDTSDELRSTAQRKAWHRAHRSTARAAAPAAA